MATRKFPQSPNRKVKLTSVSEVYINVGGVPFAINKELLASKSAKIATLLKDNPQNRDISHLLKDMPADAETFEIVARFCHGYEIKISTENVFHIAILANYLGMTENHSPNNLLRQALHFFQHQILHDWNKSIRALKSAENILHQAVPLGLVDDSVESIITMVLQNPCLLGQPFKDSEDREQIVFRPNVSRKLFALDWKTEDLTVMSLMLYEPIIQAMIQREVPVEFVSASLYQYAKRWAFSSTNEGGDDKRNSQREVIEAVERLLPTEKGLLPCKILFEMLNSSMALDSSNECQNGFEVRIGKQLDEANVEDLLVIFQGHHGKDQEKFDSSECIKRILKNFYHNYTANDSSGLIAVAELVDSFLAEIANEIDLKISTFISIAELSIAASDGVRRTSDPIYRAIDIYFDKHRYLTESEREEVCKILDCNKMSPEAREHAAQNARLPLRAVVQVLFVGQLKLRDAIPKEDVVGERERESRSSSNEEEVRAEMERMSNKVVELEKECYLMKRELENGVICKRNEKVKMWNEVKRKFGCISLSTMNDCNCHVKKKKVHPR